jgi:hypothetical protein
MERYADNLSNPSRGRLSVHRPQSQCFAAIAIGASRAEVLRTQRSAGGMKNLKGSIGLMTQCLKCGDLLLAYKKYTAPLPVA